MIAVMLMTADQCVEEWFQPSGEKLKEDQKRFIKEELFSMTLMATVQRAGVYDNKKGIPEKDRKKFQQSLKQWLEEKAALYTGQVTEKAHFQNICQLSRDLTKEHSRLLAGGKFRIGTAQKALNLYLKYLWCLGKIRMPPHCPFDAQIIKKIPKSPCQSWTKLKDEEEYLKLVAAANDTANPLSLAVWELREYNSPDPGA
jgi:hypothetical protein